MSTKYIHTCSKCGGTEVARLCWVNANTEQLQPNAPVGSDVEYCFTCNDETNIISLIEVPDEIIGYFDPRPEMGLFVVCDECVKTILYHGMNDPVKIYHSNVAPYKQTCHNCGCTLVTAKGESWPELFSKPVPPASPVYLEQEPHIFDDDPPTTAESDPLLPPSSQCECDSTHEQNDTVCQWCWSKGRRKWFDPDVEEDDDSVDDDPYSREGWTTKKEFTGEYIICDAGIFKGQPRYAPYVHDQVRKYNIEETVTQKDGVDMHYYRVTVEDIKEFPELDDWYFVKAWTDPKTGTKWAARTTNATMIFDRNANK